MATLSFKTEWEADTGGVTHSALARTWARLEIDVGDHCVTRAREKATGGTRDGVYGPLFLVAEWIVRNFWFLLEETAPAHHLGASWLRRHSLVAAREGTSLPDLRLFRDEDRVIASWVPCEADANRPVAFIGAGHADLDVRSTRQRLSEIVDLVLEHLRGDSHPDVAALAADWEAITSASGDDLVLCKRAAQLGLDAFDEHDVPDDLAHVLIDGADRLPSLLRRDILDSGIAPAKLAPAVGALAEATVGGEHGSRVHSGAPKHALELPPEIDMRAHDRGYSFARKLRVQQQLSVNGRLDLDGLLGALGWRSFLDEDSSLAVDRALKGVVGLSERGSPRLVAPPRPPRNRRFLQARGMYLLFSGATKDGARALTGGGSSLQAASRAFAAELLAPAEVIAARVAGGVDDEAIDDLADELDVSPLVIAHQLENHRLGGRALR